MGIIKKNIKYFLQLFNLDIIKLVKKKQDKYRVSLLNELGINLVADIGANVGQYAKDLKKNGYKGKIISFEPLSCAYKELLYNSTKYNNWVVYEQCALGNIDGEIEINVAINSESSSIFNVLKKSVQAEPKSSFVKKETVPIRKLSSVLAYDVNTNIHIKIDVQGYEEHVLKGAGVVLSNASSIELEISLIPLYEGALTPELLLEELTFHGFKPVFYTSVFDDIKTGGILQLNGFFVKENLINKLI